MTEITKIDELLYEGEVLLLTPSDLFFEAADEDFYGLYEVTDTQRGDREFCSVKGSEPKTSLRQGVLSQTGLGVNYRIYRLSIEENPEYFL